MEEKRILIVEDERVVAEDLKGLVEKMGYTVTGIAASGEEALRSVQASQPNLVLMDIRIQGSQDGIEIAEHLFAEYNVPVVYLTAYADPPTLERAKSTMPFGYILKPFEVRSLQTIIELSIHRHKMETMLQAMDGWHARALNSMTEPVIAADAEGHVTYMNKAAEDLTGSAANTAFGKPLATLLPEAEVGAPAVHPERAVPAGAKGPRLSGNLKTKNASVPVTYTRAPLPGEDGAPDGALFVLNVAP